MSRLLGLILAVMLILVARSAQAQVPAAAGGFGFDYAQPMPGNSYVLDRWWMMQATPGVGDTLPPSRVVQQPAAVQPAHTGRATRATRSGRSFSRVGARSYYRTGVPASSPLPTGSLYWPATAGMPLYSPAQRYVSYGQGYGISPYGSADYGAQYKGIYWGGY